MRQHFEANKEWLDSRSIVYPHRVEVSTDVRPERVYGDHVSAVLATGVRTYAFRRADEFKAFCEKHHLSPPNK